MWRILLKFATFCARKAIIEAAKRIINSDKVCHSYSALNFGVTFLEHSVFLVRVQCRRKESSRSLSHLLMSFLSSVGLHRRCHLQLLNGI